MPVRHLRSLTVTRRPTLRLWSVQRMEGEEAISLACSRSCSGTCVSVSVAVSQLMASLAAASCCLFLLLRFSLSLDARARSSSHSRQTRMTLSSTLTIDRKTPRLGPSRTRFAMVQNWLNSSWLSRLMTCSILWSPPLADKEPESAWLPVPPAGSGRLGTLPSTPGRSG